MQTLKLVLASSLLLLCLILSVFYQSQSREDVVLGSSHLSHNKDTFLARYVSVYTPCGIFALPPGTPINLCKPLVSGSWLADHEGHQFGVKASQITNDTSLAERLRAFAQSSPRALAEARRRQQVEDLSAAVGKQMQIGLPSEVEKDTIATSIAPGSPQNEHPVDRNATERAPVLVTDNNTSTELAKGHLTR